MSNRHITKTLHPEASGNITDVYKNLYTYDKLSKNDGNRTFIHLSLPPTTGSQNNIPVTQEIELPLSDANIHNTAIHDSFISTTLTTTITIPQWPTTKPIYLDLYRHLYDSTFIYFGFKAASDSISRRHFNHQGAAVTNTLNTDCVVESFLDNMYKPESEKKNRRYTYSLYDDIHNYNLNNAGVYVSLAQLYDGDGTVKVDIPLNIPYDDLVELQAFRDYPGVILGRLSLSFNLASDGMVYTQVAPKESIDKEMFLRGHEYKFIDDSTDTISYKDIAMNEDRMAEVISLSSTVILSVNGASTCGASGIVDPGYYDRGFHQINTSGKVIYDLTFGKRNSTVIAFKYMSITPTITDIVIKTITSELDGYGQSKEGIDSLVEHFREHPMIIPAQRVEVKNFDNAPTAGGINAGLNIPFSHVTNMAVLFPQSPLERTCFKSPEQKGITLNTFSRNFPEKPIDLRDPKFVQMMINASDLDSLYCASAEYMNSLMTPRTTPTRRLRDSTDLTSFAITYQVERSGGAGIYFDGLDSKGESMTVSLNSSPIYQGDLDTYYIPDLSKPSVHPPPPLFCMVKDTFWVFSLTEYGPSCVYVTKHSLEEALQNPAIIQAA